MINTYFPDQSYHALAEALAAVEPDPATGRVEKWQIVEILGEIGNLWPDSIKDEVEGLH